MTDDDKIIKQRIDGRSARWRKVLNKTYSQRLGRAEWFRRREGQRRSGLPFL